MQENTQPIEKKSHQLHTLDVHSVFHTIQGEGPFSGEPATFIRLAGCNLQCPACDTDYTTDRETWQNEALAVYVNKGTPDSTSLVVITGGEPFRQAIGPFVTRLLMDGFRVQVETNGTIEPDEMFRVEFEDTGNKRLFVVVSPKTGRVKPWFETNACAWKYVAEAQHFAADGLPITALRHPVRNIVARPPGTVPAHNIYLQPMDAKDTMANVQNTGAVVMRCMLHGYRLNLQVHKIINVD